VTAKEIVLARYPQARAKDVNVMVLDTLGQTNWEHYWDIMPGRPRLGQEPIGSGPTRETAWQDAANRIRQEEER
jgi:hypothetical protein